MSMWDLKIQDDTSARPKRISITDEMFSKSEEIAKNPIDCEYVHGVSLMQTPKPSGRYSQVFDCEAGERLRSSPPSSRVRPVAPQPEGRFCRFARSLLRRSA